MIYLILNCDISACFSTKDKAINFVLDNILTKLKIIEQNNIQLNKYIIENISIIKTELDTTNIYEELKYSFEEFNFIDNICSVSFSTDDLSINNKLKNVKKLINKIDIDLVDSTSDSEIYINSSSSFKLSSINDESSDKINTDINQEIIYSNNTDSKVEENTDNNEGIKNENNEITNQNKILIELSEKKKKLERYQEIIRKFEIDYNLYTNLKKKYNINNIPEIFKNKFILFDELEKRNIFEDKDKCKIIYINNYNKINTNICTSIHSNLFDKNEPEEIS